MAWYNCQHETYFNVWHIKKDITDIGIQAGNRDAMLAWRSYQEDILFDDFDINRFDSILDEFEEFNEC